MTKLIFGCGYLGSRVARRWQAQGEEVFVVTRSGQRAREFSAEGLRPIVADVLRPDSLTRLPKADTVLFAVGYDRSSGASIYDVYVAGLRDVLASLSDDTRRFIYISSTGVYGQSLGESVDETSPTEPTRDGGRACLAAEQTLAADRLGERGIVLRMAGIYGPGRIPLADLIRRGDAIPAPAESSLNLIHVEDAARVVLAAEVKAVPPRTYVVSDGHPAMRREYYEELARLLAAPPPSFAPPDPAAMKTGRSAGDKRIDNARLVAELDVELEYPSFREGLAAIVAEERHEP
jgi:nucleoside-diphosphate-sugar epimerase